MDMGGRRIVLVNWGRVVMSDAERIEKLESTIAKLKIGMDNLWKDDNALRDEMSSTKLAVQLILHVLRNQMPAVQTVLRQTLETSQLDYDKAGHPAAAAVLRTFRDSLGKEPPAPPKLYIVPKPTPED